jgi:hypothetical protein
MVGLLNTVNSSIGCSPLHNTCEYLYSCPFSDTYSFDCRLGPIEESRSLCSRLIQLILQIGLLYSGYKDVSKRQFAILTTVGGLCIKLYHRSLIGMIELKYTRIQNQNLADDLASSFEKIRKKEEEIASLHMQKPSFDHAFQMNYLKAQNKDLRDLNTSLRLKLSVLQAIQPSNSLQQIEVRDLITKSQSQIPDIVQKLALQYLDEGTHWDEMKNLVSTHVADREKVSLYHQGIEKLRRNEDFYVSKKNYYNLHPDRCLSQIPLIKALAGKIFGICKAL